MGGDDGTRLEGSLSGKRSGAVTAGQAHVGLVYKGATRKEDLCVKLMLRPDRRSFRWGGGARRSWSAGGAVDANLVASGAVSGTVL